MPAAAFGAVLAALAALNAGTGLVEQTGASSFTKRALGVGAATSVPTRADGDARWAAASHGHAAGEISGLAAVATSGSASDLATGTLPDARLPARLGVSALTVTDWNDAVENGYFMGNGAANGPTPTGWYLGSVERHNALWMTQTVHAFTSDSSADSKSYRRDMNNGVWGAWYRLRVTEGELDARYAAVSSLAAIALSGSASDLASGTVPDARLSGTYTGITALDMANAAALVTVDRSAGAWVLAPQTDSVVHLKGAIGFPVRLFMDARGTSIAHAPNIAYRWARENAGNPSAALSGDILGLFSFFGYGTSAYSSQARAQIRGIAAENWTDTAQGTRLAFFTTALGAAAVAERFAIEPDGTLTGAAGLNLAGNLDVSKAAALVATFEGDAAVDVVLARYSTNATPAGFNFYKGRGTRAAPAQVLAADDILEITARAYDNSGTPVVRAAARQIVEAVSNITTTSAEARYVWLACPAASLVLTELMRADHAGGLVSAVPVTAPSFAGSGAALTALNASELDSGTIPNGRLSGAYTGLSSIAFTTGVVSSDANILHVRQTTADAADTLETRLSGGGSSGSTRGGSIHLYGNEHATQGGMIRLIPGAAAFVAIEGANGADIAGTLTVPSVVVGALGIITAATDHLDITMLTADGADNDFVRIGGGGAIGTTRGAVIQLFGNEHATQPGHAFIQVAAGKNITLDGIVIVDTFAAAALNALVAQTPAADRVAYYTSASAAALMVFTAFARTLVANADAAAARLDLVAAGYDTTTVDTTVTFPIGHYVWVQNKAQVVARNSAQTPQLGAATEDYLDNGAGTALTGTWRARGTFNNWTANGGYLAQRVA